MPDGVMPFDAHGLAALHTETLRLSRLIGPIERLAEAETHPVPLRIEEVPLDELAREAHEAVAAGPYGAGAVACPRERARPGLVAALRKRQRGRRERRDEGLGRAVRLGRRLTVRF